MADNQQGLVRDRRSEALGSLRALPDEVVCEILDRLTVRDVGRLACVSSVMYIFCNEEPLWMNLCLKTAKGQLQYKGSWKKTALHQENLLDRYVPGRPLQFDGFNSIFLYRRLYRCHTTLNNFAFDDGNVERRKEISIEEFSRDYDGKKPVLIDGLADTWPARSTWTPDQLIQKYGETAFKISQRSSKKVTMKLKDYVSYMELQHDEDPLYVFDDKFGEVAPDLLNDYSVPHLFQEDFFDVLGNEVRPAFRWLIVGPERSGASWHVDPALTSAWNTLLCGRKRWALYPPGRVPVGVTVHVNEEDGDVNVDTPTSLQWWLDFYPLLADKDKPIELTQLPGETIFVPTGWWHCILNLETTVAVTQNFVNSKNFEYVCLDFAPGYQHKGVCRAGLLALDEDTMNDVRKKMTHNEVGSNGSDVTRESKRFRIEVPTEDSIEENAEDCGSETDNHWDEDISYDIKFLSMLLDKERDHYNSQWSLGNCIGQREMRDWLCKLWAAKPKLRELIWKGACLALNAGKWSECMLKICAFHQLPAPSDDDRLPVGSGSNPVYLAADHVIKIFVEGGLESCILGLGTELEFYSSLQQVNSPLKNHVPEVFASGILFLENGSYNVVQWDGKEVPDVILKCKDGPKQFTKDGFPFGLWSKKLFEYRTAGMSVHESNSMVGSTEVWPYIITKRCEGKMFAQLRDALSEEDSLELASFLGEQLCNLHLLPCPSPTLSETCLDPEFKRKSKVPDEWELSIAALAKKKTDVANRLTLWGEPIPRTLIDKVHEYLPDDFSKLLNINEDVNGQLKACKRCCWIHSDIMDDNIFMEPRQAKQFQNGHHAGTTENPSSTSNGFDQTLKGKSWRPSHIIDFSNLSVGDPILDVIPIHLDVFRGDPRLLNKFLESYRLPLMEETRDQGQPDHEGEFGRLSYHAMCYCVLHEENILGAIFGMWKHLRTASSWEEVEEAIWGELNNYKGHH
uniref:F-box protein n=1 Tax=Kalanchoe fedtschenkoi TaxID=63787 RepID=A0A7N0UM70_KALFE